MPSLWMKVIVVFIKSNQQQVKRRTPNVMHAGFFWPAQSKQIEITRSKSRQYHTQKNLYNGARLNRSEVR